MTHLMDYTLFYRCWQTPFARNKLLPLLDSGEIAQAKSVLDIGCGPGVNAAYFASKDYFGIDINPSYIDFAKKTFSGEFMVADATDFACPHERKFDFVLINSLLHHLSDAQVIDALKCARSHLVSGGTVHILDMLLPVKKNLVYAMAKLDRGTYVRSRQALLKLCSQIFTIEHTYDYPLGLGPLVLWNMVALKGGA